MARRKLRGFYKSSETTMMSAAFKVYSSGLTEQSIPQYRLYPRIWVKNWQLGLFLQDSNALHLMLSGYTI